LVEQGLTSHSTQFRSFRRRCFLQVRWPNQRCQSTEGGWLVIQIPLNLTRLILSTINTHVGTQNQVKHWVWPTICSDPAKIAPPRDPETQKPGDTFIQWRTASSSLCLSLGPRLLTFWLQNLYATTF